MKKIMNKIAFIAIIISLLSISCQKDADFESIETNDAIKVVSYSNPFGKTSSNEILVFRDKQTYINTLQQLEQAVEDWDDAFVDKWGYLDDDALNDKEEELGFDDEKPLTDFENQYSFHSLRKEFLNAEENWLNHEELDENESPMNRPIFDFDESEMTLLNDIGEIQIENVIYKKLTKNETNSVKNFNNSYSNIKGDAVLLVTDGKYETLSKFNSHDYSIFSDRNVKLISLGDLYMFDDPFILPDDFFDNDSNYPNPDDDIYDTCKGGKVKTQYFSTGSNKKVFTKVKISGRRAKAKNRSYKKRNGKWKKWRTYMEVTIKGAVRPANDCFYFEYVHKKNTGRKKRIKAIDRAPQNYRKVLENELWNLNKHNSVENILYLTW